MIPPSEGPIQQPLFFFLIFCFCIFLICLSLVSAPFYSHNLISPSTTISSTGFFSSPDFLNWVLPIFHPNWVQTPENSSKSFLARNGFHRRRVVSAFYLGHHHQQEPSPATKILVLWDSPDKLSLQLFFFFFFFFFGGAISKEEEWKGSEGDRKGRVWRGRRWIFWRDAWGQHWEGQESSRYPKKLASTGTTFLLAFKFCHLLFPLSLFFFLIVCSFSFWLGKRNGHLLDSLME